MLFTFVIAVTFYSLDAGLPTDVELLAEQHLSEQACDARVDAFIHQPAWYVHFPDGANLQALASCRQESADGQ